MGLVELVVALAIISIIAVLVQYFAAQIGLPAIAITIVQIILLAAFVIVCIRALLPLVGF